MFKYNTVTSRYTDYASPAVSNVILLLNFGYDLNESYTREME
jgi:hypothetical protein